VFDCLRHHYSYSFRMQSTSPRRLVIASILAEGGDPRILFTGEPYAPAPLTSEEAAVITTTPRDIPLHVRGEFPAWLQPELESAFGGELFAEMAALQTRATVDIRVNTLKTSREALAAALAAEDFIAKPTPHAATCLRLDGAGAGALSASPLFAAGHFEFQDEAGQVCAALCGAKPGMRVLDYAAGGGGKTLALAAMMANQGELVAHDIGPQRLAMIGPRAERAGVTIIRTTTELVGGAYDCVLLDTPCSGTGTWRRQPGLRVRLTPERLAELAALQATLLDRAAGFVAPGGRLVYATCSILPRENDQQVAAFLDTHPEFTPVPVSAADTFFHASPRRTQTDGFFTAILQRRT
jgi:16S rRNA (cytosine967-C5)-methyltransferase